MKKKVLFIIAACFVMIFSGCLFPVDTTTTAYPSVEGNWKFSIKTGNSMIDTATFLLSSMTTNVKFSETDSAGKFTGTLEVSGMQPVPISGTISDSGKVTIKYDPVLVKMSMSDMVKIGLSSQLPAGIDLNMLSGLKVYGVLKLVSTLDGVVEGNKMSGTGKGSTDIDVVSEEKLTGNVITDMLLKSAIEYSKSEIKKYYAPYMITTSAITWTAAKQ